MARTRSNEIFSGNCLDTTFTQLEYVFCGSSQAWEFPIPVGGVFSPVKVRCYECSPAS